tara:strand:- start:6713 stop:6892 length:180 start_codon:yes stop_codon:yes gene_type:complete
MPVKSMFFLLAILILSFTISCNNSSQKKELSEIDFSTLETLNYSVELEIGENDDFLPGR